MDFQDGHLNELWRDCAERQKKGLHFILASVFIWAAVLVVHLTSIGTKLRIPGGSSSSASAKSAASGSTYTVKKGDSYYTIGKKLGVNYLKLMKANGGDDKLKPGQVITIP